MAEPKTETFAVTVNYGLAVEESARAGQYGWLNESITSFNFPTARSGGHRLEAVLVHFGRVIETDDVLAELDKMGLRAGELRELLAVGAEHPDKQREFPIVALDSKWQGQDDDWCVPCLDYWFGWRKLSLRWFTANWCEECRFLAFRK